MKKNFSFRFLPVFCFIATLALGCGGDDDPVTSKSCEKDASAFQSALNNLMADIENVDKCKAFKAAAAEDSNVLYIIDFLETPSGVHRICIHAFASLFAFVRI